MEKVKQQQIEEQELNPTQVEWQQIVTSTKAKNEIPVQRLISHLMELGLPGHVSQGLLDYYDMDDSFPAESKLAHLAFFLTVVFGIDVTGEEEEKHRLMEKVYKGKNEHFGKGEENEN